MSFVIREPFIPIATKKKFFKLLTRLKILNTKVAGYFKPDHLKSLSKFKGYDSLEYLGRIPWNDLNDFYEKLRLELLFMTINLTWVID